jgi:hypothetical protein
VCPGEQGNDRGEPRLAEGVAISTAWPLGATPEHVGSSPWCSFEKTRARIDIHDGSASAEALDSLLEIEASFERVSHDHKVDGDIRKVMQQAQERLGDYEQALVSHK